MSDTKKQIIAAAKQYGAVAGKEFEVIASKQAAIDELVEALERHGICPKCKLKVEPKSYSAPANRYVGEQDIDLYSCSCGNSWAN